MQAKTLDWKRTQGSGLPYRQDHRDGVLAVRRLRVVLRRCSPSSVVRLWSNLGVSLQYVARPVHDPVAGDHFVLGWPLEWTEIIIIFVPIFLPLLEHFNIDPVFGALVFVNLQAAFLSPPVAMSAFYLKGVAPACHAQPDFRGMMPYMLIVILCMVIMYLWPGMTLWLPNYLTATEAGLFIALADRDLSALTATQAAAEIARGAVSSEDVTRACLDRIEATEGTVKAFAHLDREHALAQARETDQWRRSGRPFGPLYGVPVAVKDIIETADWPTECGSPLLAGRRPRNDATVVSKLRAAGAVIVGKTVTTEFAYFTPGKTRNPRDPARTPGGSSSGSAAAVAAGMVPIALGSQTNGSIIRPGAFCGVFAMKPSHGLVSRAGVLPLSRTLDHVGPFGRSIEDIALALDAIAGFDADDPDTRPLAASNFRKTATEEFGLDPRLAFVKTPMWDKADADRVRHSRILQKNLARSVSRMIFRRTMRPPGTRIARSWRPRWRTIWAS